MSCLDSCVVYIFNFFICTYFPLWHDRLENHFFHFSPFSSAETVKYLDIENLINFQNDSRLDRTARCWPRMTHASGDRVARGDCVLLRASQARAQPFVARIASLWENPDDGKLRP